MSICIKKKKKFIFLVFSSILLFSISYVDTLNLASACDEKIGYLLMRYHLGGATSPTYADYIKDNLADIGIEVTIINEGWDVHFNTLFNTHDFDITNVWLSNGGFSPDNRVLFTEEGYFNFFQLTKDIPYQNQSEQMQNLGVTLSDFSERQQLYFDWQQLVMDKIVPIIPLNTYQYYLATWSNIKGYNMRWGWDASSPYMSFEGLHEGQLSIDEFNLRNRQWNDLNPLTSDDFSSINIWSLCSDPIIIWSPEQIPKKSGLVYNWEQITDNHFKFFIRDNVYWNPSFNITNRNASSPPLLTETSPNVWEVTDPSILMLGLKNNEMSNGVNQQITAKDAVFTYLALGNLNISEEFETVEFISDIYADPVDNLAFHILIDKDPDTEEIEPYIDFFYGMSQNCLPEFFLNSSRINATYSSGGVKTIGLYDDILNTPQWRAFSKSCFGHGKFMLDYYLNNTKTVLTRSPYWFGVGAIDGRSGLKPFVDKINFHVYSHYHDVYEDFKLGLIDCYEYLSPDERKEFQSDIRFTVHSEPGNYIGFIGFNFQRSFVGGDDNNIFLTEEGKEEYTKACAVRKAISYAIDRNEINEVFHEGENIVAHSVIYPYTTFYYYGDIIKYDYNLDKAREWLEAAGYIKTESTNATILSCILAMVILQISFPVKRRKSR